MRLDSIVVRILKMGDKALRGWYPTVHGLMQSTLRFIWGSPRNLCKNFTQWLRRDVRPHNQRSLNTSLYYANMLFDEIANDLRRDFQLQRPENNPWLLCHSFNVSPAEGIRDRTVADVARNWLHTHEDAQVMIASVLVVIGLWWLVRTILALILNLICPLLVVVLAVVCVPQLRTPLLGQNYPVLANLLRNILLKMAENLKIS